MEPMDLRIGDEVVVYAKGRIRAMDEQTVWVDGKLTKRIKYSVDYPNDAGYASVTGEIIERGNIDTEAEVEQGGEG